MPIEFRIDKARMCVFATGAEPLTDSDLRQYQLDLAAHPDHGAGFDQLVDLRAVRGLDVTSAGVRAAGHLSSTFEEFVEGTKCALVVSTEVAYGMARMFESHASEAVGFHVFEDLEAAKTWLGLTPEHGGPFGAGSDATLPETG